MTKIGVSATREGITKNQLIRFLLYVGYDTELHHGDCIGGDETCHFEAWKMGVPIKVHPPEDSKYRAWCGIKIGCADNVIILPEKPYLPRNRDIVHASDLVLILPKGYKEELRSGTWSTYRYAKDKKETIIVYPDGSVKT